MEKQTFLKRSRMWLLVPTVCVLMILIALRLYVITGETWHVLAISVVPSDTTFQLEVTSPNPQIDIAPLTDGLQLSWEKTQAGGMAGWKIQGQVSEESVGNRQEILVDCVDDQDKGVWKIRSWQNTGIPWPYTVEKKTMRWMYLLAALLESVCVILFCAECRKGRYGNAAEAVLKQVCETSQPDMMAALKTGETFFHRYEKQAVVEEMIRFVGFGGDMLLVIYLVIAKAGSSRGGSYGMLALLYLLVILTISMRIQRKRSLQALLQQEARPLTAACANLMAASCGNCMQKERQMCLYHAALGFQRAGKYEEALLVSNYWRSWQCRNPYLSLQESRVRLVCLKMLGRMEEATQEEAFQKQIQERNPSLKKRKAEQLYAKSLELKTALREHRLQDACEAGLSYLQQSKEPGTWPRIYDQLRSAYLEMGNQEQAKKMERRLLTFSPENREVRELFNDSGQSLSWEMDDADMLGRYGKQGRILRIGTGLLTGVLLMGTLSIWISQEQAAAAMEVLEGMEKEELPAATDLAVESIEPENTKETEISRSPSFSVELPEDWSGRIVEKETENGGRIYYQKSSYEKMGDGMLFSIVIYKDGSYIDVPESRVIGTDGSYVYLFCKPTDVCFDREDEAVWNEYISLLSQTDTIIKTFRIHSRSASYDGEEYVFPNSHQVYLKEEELWNLPDSVLRLAKNEIYARHGRKFQDRELQACFESRTWYHGTVEPAVFDEGVFNQYEQANVLLIQKEQDRRAQEHKGE